jgi:Carbon-nitrogen hydrolase
MYRATVVVGYCISLSFRRHPDPNRIATCNKTQFRKWKTTTYSTTICDLLLLYSASRYYNCMSHAMSSQSTSSSSSSSPSNKLYQMKKIAVGQVCSTSSKWDNLLKVAMCAGWSSKEDCCMLFLPECFGFLGLNAEETLRAAEPSTTSIIPNPDIVSTKLTDMVKHCSKLLVNEIPENKPDLDLVQMDAWKLSILDGLRVIARASNLWISAGSIHICAERDGVNHNIITTTSDELDCRQVYNTHIIIDNTGMIRTEYRKIHLFDVCIPGKVDLQESKTTRPGTELIICPDSPIGTYQ